MEELRLQAMDLNQQSAVLIKAGNLEIAKKKLEQAIALDPMLMDSYKNYGDLFMTAKEYDNAKSYYKKALLIEKQGVVYFLYGNACFLNDEPHEGLKNYNLALSAGYDGDEMLFFMGIAYEHLNDDQMALRYIQKAIVKNPSRPDYKVKKISVLLRMNMVEEAEEAVEQLLIDEPELFEAYHIKTSIMIELGKLDKAIEFAKLATDRFPEDPDLFYDYAHAVALKKDYDVALDILSKAKRLKYYDGVKAKFVSLEAQIYAEKNQIDEAISCCKQCIELEDGYFEAESRFMLSSLYLAKAEYENALKISEELVEQNQKDSYYFSALYYRAFCMKQLEKPEARKFYEEAVKLYRLATLSNPEALDAYLYRAMCLKDIEKYEEALEVLEFLEGITKEIAEVYTIRADIYKLSGKQALAKEELEKAYAIKPELKNVFKEEVE